MRYINSFLESIKLNPLSYNFLVISANLRTEVVSIINILKHDIEEKLQLE
jgi:hypothetical protein